MIKSPPSAFRSVTARVKSTAIVLLGLTLTSVALPDNYSVDIFKVAAVGVGLSLSLATGVEGMAGVRSLIRVDILILWVLYGLTFLEFLFPQPNVDVSVSSAAAVSGTHAVLLGFAGLVVGRHLVKCRGAREMSAFVHLSPGKIFCLFLFATLVGYLPIFLAVNFDLFEMFRQMSLPRFSQSWSRGRYGDAYALLYELQMLIYLIPPIAGLIYARSNDYNITQKAIATTIVLFTFYYGFASGTRNILATYVITFLGAYFLIKPKITLWQAVYLGVPILLILLLGTVYMLEFRTAGLNSFSFADNEPATLYVDHNMVIISQITELFPSLYGFLGFEIPFYGLIHPIPRFLWPDKPEGLSISIEAALGADSAHVTFTSTFVGEAYMSGGWLAVLAAGLLFGAAAEMWNRVGHNVHSPFAQLLYASGFFCAFLTMRSVVWMSVTMLPTLALWLYGKFYGKLWLQPPASGRSAPPVRPIKP